MADSGSGKISHVNYNGYTIVDVNALLRDPKVKATIERMSKENERFRGKPGVTFIRPVRERE
jgi:2',3'-cyclic-nucleotide 2'-phosphodiesterase (5'-nucleotidase family)